MVKFESSPSTNDEVGLCNAHPFQNDGEQTPRIFETAGIPKPCMDVLAYLYNEDRSRYFNIPLDWDRRIPDDDTRAFFSGYRAAAGQEPGNYYVRTGSLEIQKFVTDTKAKLLTPKIFINGRGFDQEEVLAASTIAFIVNAAMEHTVLQREQFIYFWDAVPKLYAELRRRCAKPTSREDFLTFVPNALQLLNEIAYTIDGGLLNKHVNGIPRINKYVTETGHVVKVDEVQWAQMNRGE